MAAREYSEETKAAVMAALMAGQSVTSVAGDFGIPKGTVHGWKRRLPEFQQHPVATVATETTERLGALVLDLVETELEGLIETGKIIRDREWLLEQDASELAVLIGVRHDKLMRMLEMFGSEEADA